MKKLIVSITLLLSVFGITRIHAQDSLNNPTNGNLSGMKYYYYPSQNVYYNEGTQDYWYYGNPSGKWETAKSLPSNYLVNDKTNRYELTYNGTDVWKENKMHKSKYKAKKNGKVKMKEQRPGTM